jgi:class 3 adenylate cyclase
MGREKKISKLAQLQEELAGDRKEYYIVFVDLCGSTEYKQSLLDSGSSDSVWLNRQLIFLQMTAAHIRNNRGVVLKTLGDGLMAMFDYSEMAKDILKCCAEMVVQLNRLKSYKGKEKMRVRVSLDYGETINGSIGKPTYDPLGICVDRCSRLNSFAGPNEITYSAEFTNRLNGAVPAQIHPAIRSATTHEDVMKGLGRVSYVRVAI